MKKLLLVSLCFLMLCVTQVFAQNRTVTGTVKAKEDGLPIPGVSVTVKGTTAGTLTDVNGHFSISVSSDAKLVFSFIGYERQEVAATSQVLNVTLSQSFKQLGEVVVTGALGLTRTRNQQSYAAQQINGDEVNKTRSANFIDGLSGKISGLQITQNNTVGGSTNVIIRGIKSITGNNQALFVVDGVPINNYNSNSGNSGAKSITNGNAAAGGGGYDYGSPASDINPDDIESVTVLKGAGATALYGSRGANGVIVITTKKAKKGLGITVNSSVSLSEIDKSTFPKYQNQYGAGYGQFYNDPSGYFFYFDVNGDGKNDLVTPTTEDASFGAKFDPNLKVYQWDAFVNFKGNQNFGKATPWVAAKNGPESFFIKPLSTNQSIFITNATDNGSFKLGYTKDIENGTVPNSQINKNLVNFAATYNLSSKLTAAASINYYNTKGKGRGAVGYDGTNSNARNVMTNFREWWEVNNDVQELKTAYDATGKNITWNMADPQNGNYGAIFWNNPYYVQDHDYETDSRNRYEGYVSLNYKPTSWLNFLGRVSTDTYSTLQEEHYDVSSIGVPYYERFNQNVSETNFDFLANFDKNITNDFNLKALLGTNIRKNSSNTIDASTNGGLIVPGIWSLSNSLVSVNAPLETDVKSEVDGVFAASTLTFKKLLTLDGTIRRDLSSTLPKGNNAYWYPSVSGGFIFSELLKNSSWLSYGKLRASYAQVGNDAPAYSTIDTYLIVPPYGSNPQAAVSTTKQNDGLLPEKTKSTEVGLELHFLQDRIQFDGSWYTATTFNEILPVNVSTSTGYVYKYLNAGSVNNKGIEASLTGTPFRSKDFSWDITLNYTRNRSKVTSLFKDGTGNQAGNLALQSYQNGETLNASLGQPFGTLRGTDYTYDKNGQRIVQANGQYLLSGPNAQIGDTNPDWTGGINNKFRYKNFSLSFLVDIRKGGSVFSGDLAYGLATGLYPETVYKNDLGNPVRNSKTDGGGFIRPGVNAAGQPNTVRVSANNYSAFGYYYLPNKAFVYDAGYVKLREAVLGYTLPESVLGQLGAIKSVTLQLIGRNLWIIHKNLPYADPEDNLTAGNQQGISQGSYPTTRTISFNLQLKF